MNLPVDLRKAGVEWAVDSVVANIENERNPGTYTAKTNLRVRFCDWNSVPAGQTPPTLEKLYMATGEFSVEKMLALGMRDLLPAHPIRRAYLDSVGNTPVTIDKETLANSLAECIHVAMRKCMDSKQSAIQWNAVHHLLPEDWSHALRLIRSSVENEIARCEQKGAPLLRRNVGMAIKSAMTEQVEEIYYRDVESQGLIVKRTPVQEFALRCFAAANSLTDDGDWTFGWTSYLCKDAEQDQPLDATPQPVSS